MPVYDVAWFTPPAPLAWVTLRNPGTSAELTNVPMLLDTGADVSLVPHASIVRLGIPGDPHQRYDLVGFDGSISSTPVVRLEMQMLGRIFRGQFLVIEQEWGILGRNILNVMPVFFDGPRLTWEIRRSG